MRPRPGQTGAEVGDCFHLASVPATRRVQELCALLGYSEAKEKREVGTMAGHGEGPEHLFLR